MNNIVSNIVCGFLKDKYFYGNIYGQYVIFHDKYKKLKNIFERLLTKLESNDINKNKLEFFKKIVTEEKQKISESLDNIIYDIERSKDFIVANKTDNKISAKNSNDQSQIDSNARHKIKKQIFNFINDFITWEDENKKFPVPVVNIYDIEFYKSNDEYEEGYLFSPGQFYVDDYKLLKGDIKNSDITYLEFLKKYCNIDWKKLSKNDKSIVRNVILETLHKPKWFDDLYIKIDAEINYYRHHEIMAYSKALIGIEVKENTFRYVVYDYKLSNDMIESIIERIAEEELEYMKKEAEDYRSELRYDE